MTGDRNYHNNQYLRNVNINVNINNSHYYTVSDVKASETEDGHGLSIYAPHDHGAQLPTLILRQ